MIKICLIDDDRLVRNALLIGLEDSGYNVVAAESGIVGLELIEQQRPDIVISDLRMPGLDGAALIGMIRARFPDLPIVAMSGEAAASGLGGADAFLNKPFKMRDVAAAIAAAREKRQAGG